MNRLNPENVLGPGGWPAREARCDIARSTSEIGYIVGLLTHDIGVTAKVLAYGSSPSIRQLQEKVLVLTHEVCASMNPMSWLDSALAP